MKSDDKYKVFRQKAEEFFRNNRDAVSTDFQHDIEKVVEELNIHQIELEMQYLELHEANQKLSHEREKYHNLYMQAPVAYFTLNLA